MTVIQHDEFYLEFTKILDSIPRESLEKMSKREFIAKVTRIIDSQHKFDYGNLVLHYFS
jgi:hypothetical protein